MFDYLAYIGQTFKSNHGKEREQRRDSRVLLPVLHIVQWLSY